MRAAVLARDSGAPTLRVLEVPAPLPGAGEVLVEVAGCGFCHTDLHYIDHGVPTAKAPPIVLGHEISGRVVGVGAAVDASLVGRRVVLPAVLPCGRCVLCRTGRGNICPEMRMFGNHIDGGFAEQVVAPADYLIDLPEEIDLVRGAIIADALSTPFHAVARRAKVRPGEWVAVIGCGGVGMNLVQFAQLAGATVVAVDLSEEKLETARRLGAAETVNPGQVSDFSRAIRALVPGGVDVAFEAVGSAKTIELAFASLRRGGRVCLVGYNSAPVPVPVHKVMFLEYALLGSLGCRPADYPRIVELVRQGKVQLDPIVTQVMPLERIGEAAERLRRGEGLRTVIAPSASAR